MEEQGLETDLLLPESKAGMQIMMRDVSYTVRQGRKTLQLLNGITAYLNPGEMAAMIGPSGSGKTTLVDVLAGRKTQGEIKGEILYSNQAATQEMLRRCVGYVEQFDVLIGYLTVYEMLIYTAELKRPYEESSETKAEHVENLMTKLLLTKSKDKRIGEQGGIKKRVNIGIALISKPRILFLDEPTTGLDSYTANEIMTVVKSMALGDGTTICSTIHSPTPYTFSLFDRVLFLLGGQLVFFGKTDLALPFLEPFAEGLVNNFDNLADWLTMIIVKAGRDERGPEISAAFDASELKKATDQYLDLRIKNSSLVESKTGTIAVNGHKHSHAPVWHVFMTLLKYRSVKQLRDPSFWVSRTVDKFMFLLLLCLTFHGVGNDYSFPASQNVVSVLFMLGSFPMFAAGIYSPSIVLERALLYRELDDGMYTTGLYLLMKLINETIPGILSALIITNIAWSVLALEGSRIYFVLVYLGSLMNGITTAYVTSAVGSNVNVSNALIATYTAVLLVFEGMMILPSDMPLYWKWMYYVDYAAYAFGVLMHSTFTGSKAAEEAQIMLGARSVSILEYYELDGVHEKWWVCVVYLFVVGHFLIAYLCTRFIRHQRR